MHTEMVHECYIINEAQQTKVSDEVCHFDIAISIQNARKEI